MRLWGPLTWWWAWGGGAASGPSRGVAPPQAHAAGPAPRSPRGVSALVPPDTPWLPLRLCLSLSLQQTLHLWAGSGAGYGASFGSRGGFPIAPGQDRPLLAYPSAEGSSSVRRPPFIEHLLYARHCAVHMQGASWCPPQVGALVPILWVRRLRSEKIGHTISYWRQRSSAHEFCP